MMSAGAVVLCAGLLVEKSGGLGCAKDAKRRLPSLQERNKAALALLDEWIANSSGCEEAAWLALKQQIEKRREDDTAPPSQR